MPTEPRFYALFVGIDNYRSPNVTDLRGCVNDVKAMAAFVRAKLNLLDANLRIYTANEKGDETPDRLASRANILAGFDWLVNTAQAKDQVFIHYSGHGSQAPTVDPNNEPDGLDETIVPCDSRMVGPDGQQVYDVLDKEIKTYIDFIEASGAFVTVFFDCCHSGSGTRAGDQKVLTRKTPPDERTRSLDSVEPRTAARLAAQVNVAPQQSTASGWHISGGHVLLAGCRDEQLSHEYRDVESGAWHGATTYFLLQSLRGAQAATTWGQVYDSVRTRVNAIYNNQMPQLEGPANRHIFGELAPPADPHLLVEKMESDGTDTHVYINGGPPVGLTMGSRVDFYPAGVGELKGTPLARGVVVMVEVDHVWARVTVPPADGIFPPLARVKIAAQSYNELVYPVAAEDALVRDALVKRVEADGALSEEPVNPFLRLTKTDESAGAIFNVQTHGAQYVVQDASGVQIVVETPPRTAEGAGQVVEILEHLAVYNNVRNLRNPSPAPPLAGALKVEAFSYTDASFSAPKDGIPLHTPDGVLTPGRKIWLAVKNESSEDLYVSIFDLNPDFGIKRLYPRNTANQKVAAGKDFFIPNIRYPVSNPFLGRTQAIFKVFVTRQPMSFDVLQMEDLNEPPMSAATRSLEADNPLRRLLNSVRATGTRGGAFIDDDPNDLWHIHQIEFTVLAENTAQSLAPGETSVEIGSPLEITLQKPANFTAQVVASSLVQATRGVDNPLQPPPGLSGADAAEMFVPLSFASGTRTAIGSPGILAVNATPEELAQISEENPLRLELTLDEEEDLQGVLPIAFDGVHYFLAGQVDDPTTGSRDPNRRRLALSITHLPLPADAPADGGSRTAGDAPTRDLKRTARLFFYKVYRKELPPDTGVRKPRLNPDHTPVYAAPGKPAYDEATPVDVAGAKRTALLVHGFTSDTGWLVEKAWPRLGQLDTYDLVLTFDYETFNTGMGENGTLLAQQLTALGFGADDGVHLDIFCHSMGTQVVRALVELEGGHKFVDRVFLAGAPNAGTRIADAKKAIFWAGTILLNQAGIAPPALIANWFLKKFLDSAVSVGDLMPESALYKKLNSGTAPLAVKYFVQIGTNKPLDGGVDWNSLFTAAGLAKAFDKGLDALLGPNDLLVGVSSARGVRNGHWPDLQVAELEGHHFQYFWTDESVAQVEAWMAE
ncbi:MAG: caspase family protein [Chloroflexi bacterium]|nr:caspase family protein [Chloroflexota bacterium]